MHYLSHATPRLSTFFGALRGPCRFPSAESWSPSELLPARSSGSLSHHLSLLIIGPTRRSFLITKTQSPCACAASFASLLTAGGTTMPLMSGESANPNASTVATIFNGHSHCLANNASSPGSARPGLLLDDAVKAVRVIGGRGIN